MRLSAPLVLFVGLCATLLECNSILGISDHPIAEADGGSQSEGGTVADASEAGLADVASESVGVGNDADATAGEAATATTDSSTDGASDGSHVTDASMDGSDASACHPGDVSTFQPPAYHYAKMQAGACTSTQIADYYTACFATGSTAAACNVFRMAPANTTCLGCLLSTPTDPQYGALIEHKRSNSAPLAFDYAVVNFGGCTEIRDLNGQMCAKTEAAFSACNEAACATACPLDGSKAAFQQFQSCVTNASAGVCQAYAQQRMTCRTAESADGGAAGVCFQGSTFQDFYNAIAPVFCGGTANQAADVSRFLGSWKTTTGTTTLSACSDGVTRPPSTMVSLPVIVTQGTTSDLVVDDTYGCATKANVTGNTATILAGQTCTETATGQTLTYTTSQCTFFVHADGAQADATLLGTVTAPASSLTCMFRYDLPLTKQ